MKALTITIEDAAERDWISRPLYLADCHSGPAMLFFEGGSSVAIGVPLCPMCEIPLPVPVGSCQSVTCDGCEEEVEL